MKQFLTARILEVNLVRFKMRLHYRLLPSNSCTSMCLFRRPFNLFSLPLLSLLTCSAPTPHLSLSLRMCMCVYARAMRGEGRRWQKEGETRWRVKKGRDDRYPIKYPVGAKKFFTWLAVCGWRLRVTRPGLSLSLCRARALGTQAPALLEKLQQTFLPFLFFYSFIHFFFLFLFYLKNFSFLSLICSSVCSFFYWFVRLLDPSMCLSFYSGLYFHPQIYNCNPLRH